MSLGMLHSEGGQKGFPIIFSQHDLGQVVLQWHHMRSSAKGEQFWIHKGRCSMSQICSNEAQHSRQGVHVAFALQKTQKASATKVGIIVLPCSLWVWNSTNPKSVWLDTCGNRSTPSNASFKSGICMSSHSSQTQKLTIFFEVKVGRTA